MKAAIILLSFILLYLPGTYGQANTRTCSDSTTLNRGEYNNLKGVVPDCADPYVLKYNGTYYLYGTGGNDGIRVYTSDNLATWSKACGATDGYALHKDNVWGDFWFWAPEVYRINNKFYMFYSAQERICVAESDSPLGPFVQTEANKRPLHADIQEIDSHLFRDDDGKMYLYFVRFTDGNEIWVAELNEDLHSIKENTLAHCIGVTQNWEKSEGKVNEGPFVLKHKGLYYLTFSANDYRSPNYGVGYAISENPYGPWTKYAGNPILTGNDVIQGVGHHSFVQVTDSSQYIVYHSHYAPGKVQFRKLGIDPYGFISTGNDAPDILKVYGPTISDQKMR